MLRSYNRAESAVTGDNNRSRRRKSSVSDYGEEEKGLSDSDNI